MPWLTPSAINWQLSASPSKILLREHVGKSEIQTTPSLKKTGLSAFAEGKRLDVPESDAARLDSINLAFVGDAYYALTLRKRLVETGIPQVQVLHGLAAEFVSAKAQAWVYRRLRDSLTEEEKRVCQRARNAHSMAPKSATVAEYHDSTALEALVGFLVMAGQGDRLAEIMEQIYEETKAYCSQTRGGTE